MQTPETMDKLHNIQLGIAAEVKRICEKNDISYFIIAGTLLGAVRHQGFIPWDDDIDIGMLRADYDRFLSCASEDLSEDLFLQSWHSDEGFGLPLAKVRRNATQITEEVSKATAGHKGIFLDIFPFDEKPRSSHQQWVQKHSALILKRIIQARLGYRIGAKSSLLLRLTLRLAVAATQMLPVKFFIDALEHSMRRYNGRGNGDYVAFGGSYGYEKETLLRSWVQSLDSVAFENTHFPCFRDKAAYLQHMYGDYMTLPPVDERGRRHGVIEIKFDIDGNAR